MIIIKGSKEGMMLVKSKEMIYEDVKLLCAEYKMVSTAMKITNEEIRRFFFMESPLKYMKK